MKRYHSLAITCVLIAAGTSVLAAPTNVANVEDEPAGQVLESSVTHTSYVSEIRDGAPVVSQLWTGYRLLRRDSVCIRIEHELVGMQHFKSSVGSVDLPNLKRTEIPVTCPAHAAEQAPLH